MLKDSKENLIFVIDDDEIMRLSCQQILQKADYVVETFGNGHDGINRLREAKPQLLIVDIKMPELDGFEVIEMVRKIDADLVIVVITGYATIETAVDAMKAGAYDFLPKPFTPGELRLIVERGFERWRLTKEAQRLRHEKEEVERKFVTLVSHQLKSPLVAVKQYLDVLLFSWRDQLPEKVIEWVSRSQERLAEMLNIIQDWLALARVERGAFCDPSAATDLSPIISEVVRDQQQSPGAANMTLSTSMPADLPKVRGDAMSVTMVMTNLINNAVKYNRPGGTVGVSVSHDGRWATIDVADTGIGIPQDCLPRLFEEFYRATREATQGVPGTGLGLVICRKIVSELGGSISVESKEGEHTKFTVRLPLAGTRANSRQTEILETTRGASK